MKANPSTSAPSMVEKVIVVLFPIYLIDFLHTNFKLVQSRLELMNSAKTFTVASGLRMRNFEGCSLRFLQFDFSHIEMGHLSAHTFIITKKTTACECLIATHNVIRGVHTSCITIAGGVVYHRRSELMATQSGFNFLFV